MPRSLWFTSPLGHVALGLFCWLNLFGEASFAVSRQDSESALNPELKIGIVQRFGESTGDRLQLRAMPGDTLTLSFKQPDNAQPQVLRTNQVTLELISEPVAPPEVEERLIVSAHRSYENAEASANYWRSKGLKVEIAQPKRWQVWAQREVYNEPLLRRLLLDSLRQQGNQFAQIESRVVRARPQASWIVNGYRYSRDELDIRSGRSLIWVNRNLYAGSLRLQPNAYANYSLVNQVPLETYLRGVVPHEIGPGAPANAVQAQAVLARTYALRNLHRFEIDNYELCATTHCQVYKGLTGTLAVSDRAVTSTRGQVLTFNGQVIDALYSSATGGVTAPYSDMWNGEDRPYLRTIIDSVGQPWDLSNRSLADEANLRAFLNSRAGFNEEGWNVFRWREDSTLADMTSFLKRYFTSLGGTAPSFTTIRDVRVVERSASGRALKVEIQTDGEPIVLKKDEILQALYAPTSTLFYLDPLYDNRSGIPILKGYRFVGGGLGHGVGMSQTGSYRLGRLGWNYNRILSFYYSGTRLERVGQDVQVSRKPGAALADGEAVKQPEAN
ncbi:SpoIID/LytB domain-containing protein [Leptolyngbya sp. FACHB-261]|uniref:SpoIID/LytB domain-containing protein n=1 Tax=Leptolyngbya sp. FACHB-261 TaxID=2692806 RepID=UPI0016841394|nr:SpoIID/LytB domain-containing protein [Leptolyngbya sp. FACHB-261]MBD2104384.1 SpoIID/LytB domain-containing protein [Leptolyngbya sp. FACHB-261]